MVLANKINRINPIARALVVMGSVAALVTGVTFAALQNTATLTDNTINSNVDGLLVDSDGDDTFASTDGGFAFEDIAPGTESDPMPFTLKNSTEEILDVHVQITGEPALPAGVDPTDIVFVFDIPDGPDVIANWGQLTPEDGVLLLNDLAVDTEADVTVKVQIDPTVPDDVSIGEFDFTFGSPEVE